jgi:H3 lysine-79-specific histone-lysine N-methyltransferase
MNANNPYNLTDKEKKSFELKGYASTYGELTTKGLKQIMKNVENIKDKIFVDLGSGGGNIVIHSIKKYPLKKGVGIELSKHRHEIALKNQLKLPEEKQKKVKFYNDDILKKSFKTYDIFYISNLCFNEDTNEKIENKLFKEAKNNALIFCSKPMKLKLKLKKMIYVEQTWNKQSKIYMYQIDK